MIFSGGSTEQQVAFFSKLVTHRDMGTEANGLFDESVTCNINGSDPIIWSKYQLAIPSSFRNAAGIVSARWWSLAC